MRPHCPTAAATEAARDSPGDEVAVEGIGFRTVKLVDKDAHNQLTKLYDCGCLQSVRQATRPVGSRSFSKGAINDLSA